MLWAKARNEAFQNSIVAGDQNSQVEITDTPFSLIMVSLLLLEFQGTLAAQALFLDTH